MSATTSSSARFRRDPSAPPLDLPGFVLSTATIGLLVYTIIEAPTRGWTDTWTLVGFALVTLLAATFVARETRIDQPMLDLSLLRNPRFAAASGSVAISFFALSGFIFLVTQYFQFLKSYGPLSTGLRLLPVASCVATASILGTRLAVRIGTKAVVTTGLATMTTFYLWVTTTTASTSYGTLAAQMILLGTGMGLTSAPATEAIMGVVPQAKAGVGSAVNDATRLLGATLGVAVIGSVYASLYASHLAVSLPAPAARATHRSIGAALATAGTLAHHAHPQLAAALHDAASAAFFHGFHTANYLSAAVAAAGALIAFALLPSHPTTDAPAGDKASGNGMELNARRPPRERAVARLRRPSRDGLAPPGSNSEPQG